MQVKAIDKQASIGNIRIIDGATLLLLMGISSLLYFNFSRVNLDDSYITYRIAENATNGLGLVYNQDERVQVSTTPLFTLLLTFLGLVFPDTVANGALVSGIGLFGSSAFLYLWTRASQGAIVGLVSATLYALFPLTLLTFGMETYLYLMLAMGAIYFYFGKRLNLTAVFLAFLLLTRADGIILAAVIFLHYIWTNRRLPFQQAAWYAGITTPWFVFAQLYYGSPVPATLGAKMSHGQSFWWVKSFLEGIRSLAVEYYAQDTMFLSFALFGVIGVFVAGWKNIQIRLLFVWVVLYSVGYTLLGVPEFHWYYAPLVPAIAVSVAVGITCLPFRISSRPGWHRWNFVSLALIVLLSVVPVAVLVRRDISIARMLPMSKYDIYREAGLWLNTNSSSDSSVAMVEIGIMGYYADRRIFDIIGLTHPDTAKRMASRDFTYAIRNYDPDFVVLIQSELVEIQTDNWFGNTYRPVKHLVNERFGSEPLVIFAKYVDSDPLETTQREVTFDNKIRLSGYSIQPKSVLPGGNLRVTLKLEKLTSIQKEIGAFASIVDRKGHAVFQKEVIFRPENWEEGSIKQHFDIYVAPALTPGAYEVHTGMYYPSGRELLLVAGQDGRSVVDRLRFGPIKVANPPGNSKPDIPVAVGFGEKIALLGYNVSPTSSEPEQLTLTLFWQAREQMQQDYTVFVHILDNNGQVICQSDGQPQEGNYPTSIWAQGETVPDRHTIQLPESLQHGEYQIAVGIYYGPTGKRLESVAQNATTRDDAVLIGKVRLP